MRRLGLSPKHTAAASFLPDDLLASHIWPLYPEIGSFYGASGELYLSNARREFCDGRST